MAETSPPRTLRDPAALAAAGLIPPAAVVALAPVAARYAIAVPGAMAALIDPTAADTLPAVKEWLRLAESTRRVIRNNHGAASPEQRLRVAIEHNAVQQLDNLRTHPAVAARLAAGTLSLHAWVYDIGPGSILTWEATSGQFHAVVDGHTPDETTEERTSAH